jgi:CheY-like chemotaxis protein
MGRSGTHHQGMTATMSNLNTAGGAKLCVLVVDDNRDSADTLAMMLRILGHESHTAYDGQEAVERTASLTPDAVLLDIGMPRLNGYEAAERIRQQPGGSDRLLLALTGWGQDEDRERTRAAGFDSHLVKPVNHEDLTKLLNEHAAKRPPK